MKVLVIGDLHLKQGKINGYLNAQFEALDRIVKTTSPKILIFLGDVFDYRNPTVDEIVPVVSYFKKLALTPGLSRIIILRGNHDSANKSDSGLTALEILEYPGSKVEVIKHSDFYGNLGFYFIPHYEDEKIIKYDLKIDYGQEFIFGHFGYEGCYNSVDYNDSKIKKEEFKCKTVLGHIHQFKDDGKIIVLGTPWSTSFNECDYKHWVGIIEGEPGNWGHLRKVEVDFGPRYYICPYESLEIMKEDISNPNYFTILRVIVDKLESLPNDLKNKILEEYKVKHVDISFKPLLDKKLEKRISDYQPQELLSEITDDVIDKYIEEQSSSAKKEDLLKGLEEINKNANNQNKG